MTRMRKTHRAESEVIELCAVDVDQPVLEAQALGEASAASGPFDVSVDAGDDTRPYLYVDAAFASMPSPSAPHAALGPFSSAVETGFQWADQNRVSRDEARARWFDEHGMPRGYKLMRSVPCTRAEQRY